MAWVQQQGTSLRGCGVLLSHLQSYPIRTQGGKLFADKYSTVARHLTLDEELHPPLRDILSQPSRSLPFSTMNPSAAILFCLILLSLSGTQGIPLTRTVRCTCISIDDRPVKPKALSKLEIIPASLSCPHVEIVATMRKNGEKRCLNPESEAIKSLLKAVSQKRSKRAH